MSEFWSRFTEAGLKAVAYAQEETRRLGHKHVGSEAILLGLMDEKEGIAARALKASGVTLAEARNQVEKIVGRDSKEVTDEILPFTPRAKRMLEIAWKVADEAGAEKVDTEHLLLAIVKDGEGIGPRVLENLGVSIALLQESISDEIEKGKQGEQGSP